MKGIAVTPEGTFRPRVKWHGKNIGLGCFLTEHDAIQALNDARARKAAGLHPGPERAIGPLDEKAALREKYDYDRDTGVFTFRAGRNVTVGVKAGGIHNHGYISFACGSRFYLAHRVAWMFEHGEWPDKLIDHINGCKTDNRIANLRQATAAQNLCNSRPRNSKSGLKGVSIRPGTRAKKYKATIKSGGIARQLGSYYTPEDAHAAYAEAAKRIHGEFARAR